MQFQVVSSGTASPYAASSSFGSPVDVDTADTAVASLGFGGAIVTAPAAAAVANTSRLAASGGGEGGEHAVTVSEEAAPPHIRSVSTSADANGVLSDIYWC